MKSIREKGSNAKSQIEFVRNSRQSHNQWMMIPGIIVFRRIRKAAVQIPNVPAKKTWSMLVLKSPVIKLFNIWTEPKIIAVIHTARQIPNDDAPWNNMLRNINSSLIPTIKVLMITIIRTLLIVDLYIIQSVVWTESIELVATTNVNLANYLGFSTQLEATIIK